MLKIKKYLKKIEKFKKKSHNAYLNYDLYKMAIYSLKAIMLENELRLRIQQEKIED